MTARAFEYKHDKVAQMYKRAPWPNFRKILLRQNPICTKINNGEQCHNPSCIGHHLVSPRKRPDLFVDSKNVIALCEYCHPPDEGTEMWRCGIDYIQNQFAISIG